MVVFININLVLCAAFLYKCNFKMSIFESMLTFRLSLLSESARLKTFKNWVFSEKDPCNASKVGYMPFSKCSLLISCVSLAGRSRVLLHRIQTGARLGAMFFVQ